MAAPALDIPKALARRIAQLPVVPIAGLRALFVQTFAREPAVANRRFLERRLAYHWQAERYDATYPGVRARQRERIAALTAALAASQLPPARALGPGTVLVRTFNGTDHEVRIGAGPVFEYAGKRYASLSKVARVITGTRWSGPAFFGVKSRSVGVRP